MLDSLSKLIISPRAVQIEITNRCNLSCKMCPRSKLNIKEEDIDYTIFSKIVQRLKKGMRVILTGWGEPLLHPHILDMVNNCKRNGLFVECTTNGTLLTYEIMRKLIGLELDSITFSLDSLNNTNALDMRHHNAYITSIIETFTILKGARHKPRIILQPTLHRDKESDIYEIIKFAKRLKLDSVNIARLDTRFNPDIQTPTTQEEKEMLKKIIRLSKMLKIRIDLKPYAMFYGVKGSIYRSFRGLLFPFKKICPKPLDSIYIRVDGKVMPCCGLPNLIIGDILTQDLRDIFEKSKKEFFLNQAKMCSGCNVYKMS